VGTFVLGSAAFVALASFVLVSIARGVVSPHGDAASDDPAVTLASARPPLGALPKPRFGSKRPSSAVPAAAASKDD
jgi:hypothetical protein